MHHPALRYAMPATVVMLVILGLMPLRFLGWVKGPSSLALVLIAPISHPLGVVSHWLAPADPDREPDDAIRGMQEEARRYELLWRQEQAENDRLRRLITDLQGNRAVETRVPVDLLSAPVVATSSDPSSSVLRVGRGSRDGVLQNTVAVVDVDQLVGQVIDVAGRTASVVPVTDRAAGSVTGLIFFDGDGNRTASTLLVPWGDGRLRGEVEFITPGPGEPLQSPPEPGMTVRLDDPGWPATAQMLVLGTVERVEPKNDQPLRHVVFVTPKVELRRVREVVLRIPAGVEGGAGP